TVLAVVTVDGVATASVDAARTVAVIVVVTASADAAATALTVARATTVVIGTIAHVIMPPTGVVTKAAQTAPLKPCRPIVASKRLRSATQVAINTPGIFRGCFFCDYM
ncbi:MAG TPA: hypothetical protein VK737_00525, partial [Opitutales bacterium]|nr:hypothetical protein [Opitutales bacterium]